MCRVSKGEARRRVDPLSVAKARRGTERRGELRKGRGASGWSCAMDKHSVEPQRQRSACTRRETRWCWMEQHRVAKEQLCIEGRGRGKPMLIYAMERVCEDLLWHSQAALGRAKEMNSSVSNGKANNGPDLRRNRKVWCGEAEEQQRGKRGERPGQSIGSVGKGYESNRKRRNGMAEKRLATEQMCRQCSGTDLK